MSNFQINFVPPLEAKAANRFPNSLSGIDVARVRAVYTAEHRIEYNVNGEIFTYYPASLLTIINDIDFELRLIQGREDHPMTLSGYTVLDMTFQGEMAQLFDPVAPVENGQEKVVGSFVASELEIEFQKALSLVWGLIQSL